MRLYRKKGTIQLIKLSGIYYLVTLLIFLDIKMHEI